jgi:hypothetical protein
MVSRILTVLGHWAPTLWIGPIPDRGISPSSQACPAGHQAVHFFTPLLMFLPQDPGQSVQPRHSGRGGLCIPNSGTVRLPFYNISADPDRSDHPASDET